MESEEWFIWAVLGLILGGRVGLTAGGMSSVLQAGRAPGAALWVVLFGVLSALLGGWMWVVVFGDGPASFLGAAALGLLGAMAVQYLLWFRKRSGLHA